MKIRLQRLMADCGVAARRQCEEMIVAGRVKVNDQVVRQLPVFVDPAHDIIAVDETLLEPVAAETKSKLYYLLNKPKGILVTNFDPSERKTVGEIMAGVKERLFPVGRLDMDSRGALIMTNDGDLANRLTHPRYGIEKTYIVEVEGRMTPEDVERVKKGMWLGPVPGKDAHEGALRTERFHIKILGRERGRTILEATIAEARNREIRRVMARIGHPVRDLNRVAIAERITTKNLAVGAYRLLTPEEVEWLFDASSKEFHERARAATQQWYEQKEMTKERRRIDNEASAQREAAGRLARENAEKNSKLRDRAAKAGVSDSDEPFKRSERSRRETPIKKGKQPCVPPSGRIAGKLLGGTKLGRKKFVRDTNAQPPREDVHDDAPKTKTPHPPTPRMKHPLGGAARDDD